MKKKFPQISDSEWLVMRIVWAQAPVTANQVVEALSGSTAWKPKTIMTLLRRLVDKGAVGYQKQGRSYMHYPLVEEKDCARKERHSFLSRVYGGALKPMLVSFIQEGELSDEELVELRQILDQKQK